MTVPLLPACTGKVPFLTWDAAKKAMGHSRFKGKNGRAGIRIYRCRHCQHWHYGSSNFTKEIR